ncbi:DUF3169 family protein [Ruminococcus sp.]|uniref:DUF3169 family protein n=1 Tax=Ruminococcus sp. TaxID=41978 RepID=UPI0025F6D0FD|nr:DUF3169 family protein [Ruminococcus sp.]MBQ8966133.1 DUF3169 family protein [Ruminococcus sp.]
MNKTLKLLLKAAGLVLLMFGLGYIFGRILGSNTKDIDFKKFLKVDHEAAGLLLMAAHLLFTLVPLICAAGQLYCLKKAAAKWDGEDEEFIDSIELQLNAPIKLVSTSMILNFILFSCASYFPIEQKSLLALIPTVVFLVGMVWQLVLNEKALTLEKQLNPEKRGSTFDINFQKKWLDSCDEAQKQTVWQAGYSAYKAGNIACMATWAAAFIGQTIFKYGLMPMICVGVIWLVMNTVYINTASMLESRGSSLRE